MSPIPPFLPRNLALLIPHPPPLSPDTIISPRTVAFCFLLVLFVRMLTVDRSRGAKWLVYMLVVTAGLYHVNFGILVCRSGKPEVLVGLVAVMGCGKR
ncbi:hypothetical protein EDC01DRAFT_776950 [Geopyxis carbonaria]|nr:hypothetical protein EDC01DRAFT_776950 [Geopyxis carbonaria]